MSRLHKAFSPLLTDDVLKSLRSKKINTILDFLEEENSKLADVSGLLYKDILILRQTLFEKFSAPRLCGYKAFQDVLSYSRTLLSHIPSMDDLLRGGLLTGELVEIYGFSGSGKTQLCLTIAANVAVHQTYHVVYIDCKNDFSGSRLQSIMVARGVSEKCLGEAMTKVLVVRPTSAAQFLAYLPQLHQDIQQQREINCETRLVIVDSLPALFYPFLGEQTHLKFLGLLNCAGVALKQLASELHVAVLLVSLAQQWRDEEPDETGAAEQTAPAPVTVPKASFGALWRSVPHSRLYLARDEAEGLRLTVAKSTRLPSGTSCLLKLSQRGVE